MSNRKTTKRALMTSVLAIFMCLTMLVGTTFAWFTDTASTGVNTIQAGKLDVQLLDAAGNSLEGKTLQFVKADGATNEAVLWEPGCTYNLQPITIKNGGDLALKYKIVITGIDGDAELNQVIDWFIKVDGNTYTADTELHLTADQSHVLTISGHMQESAGNEYQGLKIENISITVYATQDTVESDSNNNQYDANATYDIPWDGVTKTAPEKDSSGVYHITNAAEFVYAMEHASPIMIGYQGNEYVFGSYVLESNIDLGCATVTGFGNDGSNHFKGTFDGRGYTISNFVIDSSDSTYYGGLFGYLHGATVKNLNVSGATVIGQKQVGVLAGAVSDSSTVTNCNVYNSTVIGTKKVGAVAGYTLNSTVTDCSATDSVVISRGETENGTTTYECGAVIGYVNSGTTASGNIATNVTVLEGAISVANGVAQQGNTYYISNAAGLQWFADQVNNNFQGFNTNTIKLTADIDLKNAEWYPIGQNENLGGHMQEFFGIFDGNGHTIKNLKIKSHTPAEIRTTSTNFTDEDNIGYGVGFFGWLSGAVKNVTFENVQVTGHHYVGVVAGYFQRTGSSDVIENCTVKNCTVVATHADNTFCGDKAGGIVGMIGAPGTIKDCHVEDTTVTAGRDAGQVVGCAQDGTITENCTATTVTVTAGGDCTGAYVDNAIVGRDLRS